MYFVTIVTRGRTLHFGAVANSTMNLNDSGRMVFAVWDEIPAFYPGVQIDSFVVMPNHIHGIIVLVGAGPCACLVPGPSDPPELMHDLPESLAICGSSAPRNGEDPGQAQGPAPTRMVGISRGDIVRRFKMLTTKRYVDGVKHFEWPAFRERLWQRNYYEHIVRNDAALDRIRRYIDGNAARWAEDAENPLRGD